MALKQRFPHRLTHLLMRPKLAALALHPARAPNALHCCPVRLSVLIWLAHQCWQAHTIVLPCLLV